GGGGVWAGPGSLAATARISLDFSGGGTEMFPFPPSPLISVRDQSRGRPRRVAPFGHPRISARQTTPRGFSQPRHVLPRPRGARASAARRVSLRRHRALPPTTSP